MQISTKDWTNYINKLSSLNNIAGQKMREYVAKNGFADREALIDYAHSLIVKYGEGSAELSCQMYDAIAEMEGKIVPAAVPAETATYQETAKAINGCLKQSPSGKLLDRTVSQKVKLAGADTMLKNALRDGAEFAWVPMGSETCAFCITLASNGWQTASKKAIKGGHAEHIHANCDCQYCVRFDGKSDVDGYNPEIYRQMYYGAEGDTPSERINSLRKQLSDRKVGERTLISARAIEKVKRINIPGFSGKDLSMIQQMNSDVLTLSKDNNNNNEVAMFYVDGKISKPLFGTGKDVDIFSNPDFSAALKSDKLRSVVLSHNHPSSQYFSADDISIFINSPSLKTVIAIGNNGKLYYLTKNNNYVDSQASDIFIDTIQRNLGKSQDEVVDIFLNRIYNMVERNR